MTDLIAIVLGISAHLAGAGAPPSPEERGERPITTLGGKAGERLRALWKEGKAAGLADVTYDNRDGAHSDLNPKLFPQMQRHAYSKEDIQARRHWAAQRTLMPGIVLGNSSTSAPPLAGGSNPRIYYVNPLGLAFLHQQYRKNNLYVYPEHRDHDPGRNGPNEGFGDLYPTNTPYLLISQGSSGSDQAFLRAVACTLAAFRPETRKKLADEGLLMPTVQMILRRSYKAVRNDEDYFTGAAHPTVFEGNLLDDLAMIERAQALPADDLPPLVQLKVVEEEQPKQFVDYCDLPANEKLSDAPQAIARIWRGRAFTRRLVVSAADSFDPEKKPLRFEWKLLRGDPEAVCITPRKDGSSAEIVVEYRPRRPIAPGSPLASTRVDIGVFARDGRHVSAPAFLTWFMLDDEARTYDAKGRLLELGHGFGTVRMEVTNWPAWFQAAGQDDVRARALGIDAATRDRFRKAAKEIAPVHQTVVVQGQETARATETRQKAATAIQAAEKAVQQAEKEAQQDPAAKETLKQARLQLVTLRVAWKAADDRVRSAQKDQQAAEKALRDFLDAPKEGGPSLRNLTDTILERVLHRPNLFADHRAALEGLLSDVQKKNVDLGRQQLVRLGIAGEDGKLRSIRSEGAVPDWTEFERTQIARWLGSSVLAHVFGDSLTARFSRNVVDPRLATSRAWRDVFRYAEDGTLLGWTRFGKGEAYEFDARGRQVLKKDTQGRPLETREVRYALDPRAMKGGRQHFPLEFGPGKTLFRLEYAGPEDRVGREVMVESGEEKKVEGK